MKKAILFLLLFISTLFCYELESVAKIYASDRIVDCEVFNTENTALFKCLTPTSLEFITPDNSIYTFPLSHNSKKYVTSGDSLLSIDIEFLPETHQSQIIIQKIFPEIGEETIYYVDIYFDTWIPFTYTNGVDIGILREIEFYDFDYENKTQQILYSVPDFDTLTCLHCKGNVKDIGVFNNQIYIASFDIIRKYNSLHIPETPASDYSYDYEQGKGVCSYYYLTPEFMGITTVSLDSCSNRVDYDSYHEDTNYNSFYRIFYKSNLDYNDDKIIDIPHTYYEHRLSFHFHFEDTIESSLRFNRVDNHIVSFDSLSLIIGGKFFKNDYLGDDGVIMTNQYARGNPIRRVGFFDEWSENYNKLKNICDINLDGRDELYYFEHDSIHVYACLDSGEVFDYEVHSQSNKIATNNSYEKAHESIYDSLNNIITLEKEVVFDEHIDTCYYRKSATYDVFIVETERNIYFLNVDDIVFTFEKDTCFEYKTGIDGNKIAIFWQDDSVTIKGKSIYPYRTYVVEYYADNNIDDYFLINNRENDLFIVTCSITDTNYTLQLPYWETFVPIQSILNYFSLNGEMIDENDTIDCVPFTSSQYKILAKSNHYNTYFVEEDLEMDYSHYSRLDSYLRFNQIAVENRDFSIKRIINFGTYTRYDLAECSFLKYNHFFTNNYDNNVLLHTWSINYDFNNDISNYNIERNRISIDSLYKYNPNWLTDFFYYGRFFQHNDNPYSIFLGSYYTIDPDNDTLYPLDNIMPYLQNIMGYCDFDNDTYDELYGCFGDTLRFFQCFASYVVDNTEQQICPENFTLDLFPNPVNSVLQVKIGTPEPNSSLVITDLNGKTLREINNIKNQSTLYIDCSDIESGILFATVSNSSSSSTKKFLLIK